ncbi:hypothetical protein BCR34DRAFT_563309 [Clohesyomyces aquaticus]|uniref:Uncharacterized protein n=1 Tax=Clohesyomyces aquaticus TaxID=1231657 RepID=A0A1Y1ZR97_9PLEO|nr:hypothetical protein BCR34DRAFT_563309 [Clohesyomyces aquaticus]
MPSTLGSKFESLQSWLDIYGTAEYVVYKREAASPHLSYEDWASSQHALGPYLYHLTLDAWDEESSSDAEDVETMEAMEPVKPASLELPEPTPAKTVTTNGNGTLSAPGSTTFAVANSEELFGPAKKRKQKKKSKFKTTKFISPEDEDSDPAAHSPLIEAATPASAAATPDGRSPSSEQPGRRTLRVRTPAQQRPYFHTAKLFEDQVEELDSDDNLMLPTKPTKPSKLRLSLVATPASDSDAQHDVHMQDQENDYPSQPASATRSVSSGKRWKKTVDEEDDDYVGKPRKQPVSAKKPIPRGKSKKVPLSEELVHSDSDDDSDRVGDEDRVTMLHDIAEQQPEKKRRKKPRARKKPLSEERVHSESDEVNDHVNGRHADTISRASPKKQLEKPRRKVGRPKKIRVTDEVKTEHEDAGKTASHNGTPAQNGNAGREYQENDANAVTPLRTGRKRTSSKFGSGASS